MDLHSTGQTSFRIRQGCIPTFKGYSYMELYKNRGVHCQVRLSFVQSNTEPPELRKTRKLESVRGHEEELLRYMDISYTSEN